ncbi:MAG: GNAT family N-acetyltransferase [Pseudochelatococcus sp.]|jgi:RimJ/RimL family protein N-acetyltransferase|uniref:GNAT family N-acetyltransferase n=1 Tax=Pseudochelatococcus sp. TaxID=2020869 RepID=UPI003D8EC095
MLSEAVRTGRLLLRPVRADDAQALFALETWNVVRWLAPVPWPLAPADVEGYVARAAEENDAGVSANYTIVCNGAPCGVIALHPRDGAYSLGYWLGEPYWGRGLMSEATEAFVDAFFARSGVLHVISGVFAGNAASLRVQEKLGFVVVGDTLRFSRPHGRPMPYYETVLGRERHARGLAA